MLNYWFQDLHFPLFSFIFLCNSMCVRIATLFSCEFMLLNHGYFPCMISSNFWSHFLSSSSPVQECIGHPADPYQENPDRHGVFSRWGWQNQENSAVSRTPRPITNLDSLYSAGQALIRFILHWGTKWGIGLE